MTFTPLGALLRKTKTNGYRLTLIYPFFSSQDNESFPDSSDLIIKTVIVALKVSTVPEELFYLQ